MPLRVHLPPPPEDLYDDPEGSREVVREAILAWTDVAGPGVPRFQFVEDADDADIPVVWAAEPDGSWIPREGGGHYIASCLYDWETVSNGRLGIRAILVMTQWRDGHITYLRLLYQTLLHEMGHALGIAGHSPDPGDIMFPAIQFLRKPVLSPRDRNTLQLLYAAPIGTPVGGAVHEN